MDYIVAQGIGIIAMGANILSYQFKSKRNILLFQMVGSLFFAVNMYLLGSMIGCLLNSIGILRTIVYLQKDRKGFPTKTLTGAFILMFIAAYILVFTLFEKEPTPINLLVEVLPVVAMCALTIGSSLTGTTAIRVCAFISSPCWLTYNFINVAIGGILCEIFTLTSVILAFVRLDKKKKSEGSESFTEIE